MRTKKKKQQKKGLSLRMKLVISYLLILIVPPLVIGYFSYHSARDNTETMIMEDALENIEQMDGMINQYIRSQSQNLEMLVHALAEDSLDDEASERDVSNLLEQYSLSQEEVEQVLIGLDNGNFVHQPSSIEYPDSFDVRERSWYQQAKASNGEIFVSAPYMSLATKKVSVTLAKALENEAGVVAIDLELDHLTSMIESSRVGKDGYLFLLDRSQSFISHPTNDLGTVAQEDFFAKMYQSEEGSFSYAYESEEKYMSFLTNEQTGWKLAGTFFMDEVDDAVNPIWWTTVTVIVITLVLGLIIASGMVLSIVQPIRRLTKTAARIGTGDLSASKEKKAMRHDEIGQLDASFEQMRVSFLGLLEGVLDKSTQVAAASQQLLASSQQNTQATEQITRAVQEVVSASDEQTESMKTSTKKADQLYQSVLQITDETTTANSTANQVQEVVATGSQAVKSSMNQMSIIKETSVTVAERISELAHSSKEINQVTSLIKEIAEQTNLLALNASIEAARAGEHGKGFAVVAEEVRKLAEQSAAASEQIHKMIVSIEKQANQATDAMQVGGSEVDNGIKVAEQAGKSFARIDQQIRSMVEKIHIVTTEANHVSIGARDFAKVFTELSASTEETTQEMQTVSASTEEQLASMEEIASSAENLSVLSEELQKLVQVFKW
ncbi:methyl-accepting chemotaxis protein [Alkalihalobacillus sp. FSL R5-0424]